MGILTDFFIGTITGVTESKLYDNLNDIFEKHQIDKLISELRKTALDSLIKHYNEPYYNNLDVYITTNGIVQLIIKMCYNKNALDYKSEIEFAIMHSQKFIEEHKEFSSDKNNLISIFRKIYNIIDLALNNCELNQEIRIITNKIKETEYSIIKSHSSLTSAELQSILDNKLKVEGVILTSDAYEEIVKAVKNAFFNLQYKLDDGAHNANWRVELKKPHKQVMINNLVNVVFNSDTDNDSDDNKNNPNIETAISMTAEYILLKSGAYDQKLLEEAICVLQKTSKEMLFVIQMIYFVTKRSQYIYKSRTIFLRYTNTALEYIKEHDYVRQLSYLKYLKCVEEGELGNSEALYDYLDLERKPEIIEYLINKAMGEKSIQSFQICKNGVFIYKDECIALVDIIYPIVSEYGIGFNQKLDNDLIRNLTDKTQLVNWVVAKITEGLYTRELLRNKLRIQNYVNLCSIIKAHKLELTEIGKAIARNLPDIIGNWK